nr:polysaccharide deacetylase family protein [Propionibacterium sp.]
MSSPLSRRGLLAGGLAGGAALLAGCSGPAGSPGAPAGVATSGAATPGAGPTSGPPATASELVSRATVPVLCWHQVRAARASDSKNAKYELVISPANFRAQLDAIKGAGYTTISPEQYRAHVAEGAALPDKPVLLTFDDGAENQASVALPEVLARGMTATLFVMTVVIDGGKDWITGDQIGALAREGITIGSHTWDHHTVDKLHTEADYETQYVGSRRTLQQLSGQDVTAFCYPGGRWTEAALAPLRAAGYTTAFQLRETPVSPVDPLLTLRRQIVVSEWSGPQIVAQLARLSSAG